MDIIFEDEHLIVVNKRGDMVVHPAAGHSSGTLVNALLFHCELPTLIEAGALSSVTSCFLLSQWSKTVRGGADAGHCTKDLLSLCNLLIAGALF